MGNKAGSKKGVYGATISKKEFEALCGIMCTMEEICSFFSVSDDTLRRWCEQTYGVTTKEAIKAHSDAGRVSLRRNQFKLSETNPTMAIWLGKQYLGQTDKTDVNVGVEGIIIQNDLPKGDIPEWKRD